MFEENEELVQMFSRFLDLKSKEERFDMVELGKHAEKVMGALDEGIRGLDNMDDFLTCLHQVGATHTKIPDFNPQYFWVSLQKKIVKSMTILFSVSSVFFNSLKISNVILYSF